MANDGYADITNTEHGFIPILHHFDFMRQKLYIHIHAYIHTHI